MSNDFTISRNDAIYREIESYYDYEHTYGLCYQMAIRNTSVIKVLKKMKALSYKIKYHEPSTSLEEYKNLALHIKQTYYFSLNEKDLIVAKNDELENSLHLKPLTITEIKAITGTLYPRKNKNLQVDRKAIVPTFKSNETLVRDILLNFALPQEEIIAEITAIKKIYAEYFSDTNLPINPKTFKDSNKSRIRLANKSKQKDELTYPKKTILQLYADMFFVYDIASKYNLEDNKTIKYIQDELLDYYTFIIAELNKDPNITDLKDISLFIRNIQNSLSKLEKGTMCKYYDDLKPLIEDLKYINLMIVTI